MLGMIIGTASVIAVLGIGKAASGGIAASLDAFGDPGFVVAVDPKQDDPLSAQLQYRDAASVRTEDAGVVQYAFPNFQRTYHVVAAGVDFVRRGHQRQRRDLRYADAARRPAHRARKTSRAPHGSASSASRSSGGCSAKGAGRWAKWCASTGNASAPSASTTNSKPASSTTPASRTTSRSPTRRSRSSLRDRSTRCRSIAARGATLPEVRDAVVRDAAAPARSARGVRRPGRAGIHRRVRARGRGRQLRRDRDRRGARCWWPASGS